MSPRHQLRRGNIVVMSAFLMVVMVALLAFAVDLGYLAVSSSELQRTADASAIAAAWDLLHADGPTGCDGLTHLAADARATAATYAAANHVLNSGPALAEQDVAVGYMADPSSKSCQLVTGGPQAPNAVRVCVRRAAGPGENGLVPFFFARVLGMDGAANQAQATAALLTNFSGFQAPAGGGNLEVLPFALDQETWNGLLANNGTDNWKWNEELGQVEGGTDGILEINLYPQGTGSPGNRGTVDIGPSNNSTADIARQILHGATPEDLEHIGGKLALNDEGKLYLNGDTGISAGVKDELASIKGKPRIIPVFQSVTGPGNNATYTVVCFAGVRIMDVKLTGSMSSKRVIIQPANVKCRGGIPGGEQQSSYFVYSPPWLVR